MCVCVYVGVYTYITNTNKYSLMNLFFTSHVYSFMSALNWLTNNQAHLWETFIPFLPKVISCLYFLAYGCDLMNFVLFHIKMSTDIFIFFILVLYSF